MTLKIEVGKTYVNGFGRDVVIVGHCEDLFHGDNGQKYMSSGRICGFYPTREDLIREVTTGPVRTVTKKEIVTGQYGAIYVESDGNNLVMVGVSRGYVVTMTKSTLAETIRTLQEVYDALED